MDNLLDNNWLVPVLAASAFVVSLFDMVCLIVQLCRPFAKAPTSRQAAYIRKRGNSSRHEAEHKDNGRASRSTPGSDHEEKRVA